MYEITNHTKNVILIDGLRLKPEKPSQIEFLTTHLIELFEAKTISINPEPLPLYTTMPPLTDNSGGNVNPSDVIENIPAVYDKVPVANNFATLTRQLTNGRSDLTRINIRLSDILVQLHELQSKYL